VSRVFQTWMRRVKKERYEPEPRWNSLPCKKRKLETGARKKSSWVWQHFECDGADEEGDKWAICQVEGCGDSRIRIVKGNTTILSHHLRKEHSILPSVDGTVAREGEQDAIDQGLMRFIVSTQSSPSLLESEEFVGLVSALNPHYRLPSSQKLRALILLEHQRVQREAKSLLVGVEDLRYCTDLWKEK
jgi:hypothetical protein